MGAISETTTEKEHNAECSSSNRTQGRPAWQNSLRRWSSIRHPTGSLFAEKGAPSCMTRPRNVRHDVRLLEPLVSRKSVLSGASRNSTGCCSTRSSTRARNPPRTSSTRGPRPTSRRSLPPTISWKNSASRSSRCSAPTMSIRARPTRSSSSISRTRASRPRTSLSITRRSVIPTGPRSSPTSWRWAPTARRSA